MEYGWGLCGQDCDVYTNLGYRFWIRLKIILEDLLGCIDSGIGSGTGFGSTSVAIIGRRRSGSGSGYVIIMEVFGNTMLIIITLFSVPLTS